MCWEDQLCPNSCRPWSVTSHSFPDLVTKQGTIQAGSPTLCSGISAPTPSCQAQHSPAQSCPEARGL